MKSEEFKHRLALLLSEAGYVPESFDLDGLIDLFDSVSMLDQAVQEAKLFKEKAPAC